MQVIFSLKEVDCMTGSFFRKLRKEKKLSQTQIAEMLGVTQAAVSKWEVSNVPPGVINSKKLAEILDVTVDELLKGEKSEPVKEVQYVPSDRSKKFIRVPILGRIPAGIPIEAIEEVEDWEDFPISDTIQGRQYFGLKIKGDSMEPEYRDGDTIIVQQQENCNSGDDCAVMVNGDDATFKRVRLHEDGLTLQPLNTKYDPRFFTAKEVQSLPVRILGVVVEIRRKVRRK